MTADLVGCVIPTQWQINYNRDRRVTTTDSAQEIIDHSWQGSPVPWTYSKPDHRRSKKLPAWKTKSLWLLRIILCKQTQGSNCYWCEWWHHEGKVLPKAGPNTADTRQTQFSPHQKKLSGLFPKFFPLLFIFKLYFPPVTFTAISATFPYNPISFSNSCFHFLCPLFLQLLYFVMNVDSGQCSNREFTRVKQPNYSTFYQFY